MCVCVCVVLRVMLEWVWCRLEWEGHVGVDGWGMLEWGNGLIVLAISFAEMNFNSPFYKRFHWSSSS